jgi:hypothetical protein
VDVMARRLGWTHADGLPEYVSGELVILDAESALSVAARPPEAREEYAVHVVDGYTVDPESLVALRWADLPPARTATTWRPSSSSLTQGPPSVAP